jgi:hypothetical protein
MARAALFHGMTRVYQELLSVRRDANEMYLVPVPAPLRRVDRSGAPLHRLADLAGRILQSQPGHQR